MRNLSREFTNISFTCSICYNDLAQAQISRIPGCTHQFCEACVKNHILTQINSNVTRIRCPENECQTILPKEYISRFLDDQTLKKYEALVINKMTNRNSSLKFCPAPGCSYPFKPNFDNDYTKCRCGLRICNVCCQVWHEGKSCLEAIDVDYQNLAMSSKIRFCMVCKSQVEKNEGCNHMTCPVCDYDFCWICGREEHSIRGSQCIGEWNPIPPEFKNDYTMLFTKIGRTWATSLIVVIFIFIVSLGLDYALNNTNDWIMIVLAIIAYLLVQLIGMKAIIILIVLITLAINFRQIIRWKEKKKRWLHQDSTLYRYQRR